MPTMDIRRRSVLCLPPLLFLLLILLCILKLDCGDDGTQSAPMAPMRRFEGWGVDKHVHMTSPSAKTLKSISRLNETPHRMLRPSPPVTYPPPPSVPMRNLTDSEIAPSPPRH